MQDRAARRSGAQFGLLALTALVVATYAYLTQTAHLGQFHDDGIYAVTGQAIANGQGYRVVSAPTAPLETKYPILYPLALSLIWHRWPAFPANIAALKALNIISLLWFLVASAVLFFRLSPWRSAIVASAFIVVVGMNPLTMGVTDTLLSDNLFAPLFVTALVIHRQEEKPASLRRVIAGASVAGAALLTRQLGLTLVVAGLLWAGREGRRHLALYALLVAALAALQYSVLRGAEGTDPLLAYYSGYEADAVRGLLLSPARTFRVVMDNVAYARDGIATFVLPGIIGASGWLFAVLGLLGLPATFRRAGLFAVLAGLAYATIVLVYPFNPVRYLSPVLPLMLLCVFEGVHVLVGILRRLRTAQDASLTTAVAAFPIAVLVAASLLWANWHYRNRATPDARFWLVRPGYEWQGFADTFDWIRANTAPSDVLASAYDPMYFLYTGRRGVRPWFHQPDTYFYPRSHPAPDVGDPRAVEASLDRLGVRYLLVEPLDGYAEQAAVERMFAALLLQYGERAVLRFTSPDGGHRVYEIRPALVRV